MLSFMGVYSVKTSQKLEDENPSRKRTLKSCSFFEIWHKSLEELRLGRR